MRVLDRRIEALRTFRLQERVGEAGELQIFGRRHAERGAGVESQRERIAQAGDAADRGRNRRAGAAVTFGAHAAVDARTAAETDAVLRVDAGLRERRCGEEAVAAVVTGDAVCEIDAVDQAIAVAYDVVPQTGLNARIGAEVHERTEFRRRRIEKRQGLARAAQIEGRRGLRMVEREGQARVARVVLLPRERRQRADLARHAEDARHETGRAADVNVAEGSRVGKARVGRGEVRVDARGAWRQPGERRVKVAGRDLA